MQKETQPNTLQKAAALYPLQIGSAPTQKPILPDLRPQIKPAPSNLNQSSGLSFNPDMAAARQQQQQQQQQQHRRGKARRFDRNPAATKSVREDVAQNIQNVIRQKLMMQTHRSMFGGAAPMLMAPDGTFHPSTQLFISTGQTQGGEEGGNMAETQDTATTHSDQKHHPMMMSPMSQIMFGFTPFMATGSPPTPATAANSEEMMVVSNDPSIQLSLQSASVDSPMSASTQPPSASTQRKRSFSSYRNQRALPPPSIQTRRRSQLQQQQQQQQQQPQPNQPAMFYMVNGSQPSPLIPFQPQQHQHNPSAVPRSPMLTLLTPMLPAPQTPNPFLHMDNNNNKNQSSNPTAPTQQRRNSFLLPAVIPVFRPPPSQQQLQQSLQPSTGKSSTVSVTHQHNQQQHSKHQRQRRDQIVSAKRGPVSFDDDTQMTRMDASNLPEEPETPSRGMHFEF